MAFKIIRHAFSMIFGNLGQALRVSVGPYAIMIVGYLIAFAIGGNAVSQVNAGPNLDLAVQEMSPVIFLVLLALIPFTLFIVAWVAVSWHRFILLEDYAGVLPAVSNRPIWPYVGRSVLYGLLIFLIAIPLFFVVGLVASPFVSGGAGAGSLLPAMLVFVAVAGVLAFVWFRIGIALPSVAVGEPISMGQAWEATKGMAGTILGVAFLLMLINGLASFATSMISNVLPIIGFVFEICVQWLTLMLGVSILTTLYGHLIEKRPLID